MFFAGHKTMTAGDEQVFDAWFPLLAEIARRLAGQLVPGCQWSSWAHCSASSMRKSWAGALIWP